MSEIMLPLQCLDVDFEYIGYDIEPLWSSISSVAIDNVPQIKDIVNEDFDCSDVDIIFLNKVFSTLKNNNLDKDFLENLSSQLSDLPIGSFMVFNDVNSQYEGRDIFDSRSFASKNKLEFVEKYYTDGYTGDYTQLEVYNVFDIASNIKIPTKSVPNKTVFFLYKKVV